MVFFQSILLLALEKRLRGKKLAAAAAIFLALFCGGIFLPGLAQVEMEEAPILAALVQGCGTPEEKLTSSGREKILQRYLELTRAAKDGAPQHRREMVRLAEELGVSILYGAQLYAEEALYNSMILLAPGQGQTQLYHKRRLVPSVEYFPLEDLLNRILNLESGIILGSYTPGEEITIFNYRGLPLLYRHQRCLVREEHRPGAACPGGRAAGGGDGHRGHPGGQQRHLHLLRLPGAGAAAHGEGGAGFPYPAAGPGAARHLLPVGGGLRPAALPAAAGRLRRPGGAGR